MGGPVLSITATVRLDFYEYGDLNRADRAIVLATLEAHERCEDKTYHAAACVVAVDGNSVATHNDLPGSHGHAEQRAITKLYADQAPGHKALKALGLGVVLAGDDLIRPELFLKEYTPIGNLGVSLPCGKCLEFMADVTGNVEDVELLLIAATGHVVKTSLRSLMPWPFISHRVRYDCNRRTPVYRSTTRKDQDRGVFLPDIDRDGWGRLVASWNGIGK
ncbi:MAG TPA: hypothetical protein VI483_00405 [Candidatus Paceibacterota bacterium]